MRFSRLMARIPAVRPLRLVPPDIGVEQVADQAGSKVVRPEDQRTEEERFVAEAVSRRPPLTCQSQGCPC